MKFRKTIGVLLLLCIVISLASATVADAKEKSVSPQAYLDNLMEKYDISGVAYVTKNGKVICQSARGFSDSSQGKEMTEDTLFPVGSVSKQFCAVAFYMLSEQGKLSVDDKLSQYFPDYTAGKDVTIRHLLTMRSGIRDFQEGAYREFYPTTEGSQKENQQIILDWLNTKRLKFKAGSGYDYSNTNTLLLSMIIEQVTGEEYEDFIKENIFSKLSMNSSGFHEELVNHPDLCEIVPPKGEEIGILPTDTKGVFQGCGDLVSTAKDMDKWLTALREYKLISKESTEDMTTVYSTNVDRYNNISVGYANNLMVTPDGGVMHGGFILSYMSADLTYFDDKFNVFVATNDATNVTVEMKEIALYIAEELKDLGIRGDASGDMKINISDATVIQKFSAQLLSLDGKELLWADANEDEIVNIKDVTAIQKYVAQIDTSFNIGEYIK